MKLHYYFLIFFTFCFLAVLFTAKFMGAYVYSPQVENKGYCELNYGPDWTYKTGFCYDKTNYKNSVAVTEEEIKSYCVKPKFISTKILNDCWKVGHND